MFNNIALWIILAVVLIGIIAIVILSIVEKAHWGKSLKKSMEEEEDIDNLPIQTFTPAQLGLSPMPVEDTRQQIMEDYHKAIRNEDVTEAKVLLFKYRNQCPHQNTECLQSVFCPECVWGGATYKHPDPPYYADQIDEIEKFNL